MAELKVLLIQAPALADHIDVLPYLLLGFFFRAFEPSFRPSGCRRRRAGLPLWTAQNAGQQAPLTTNRIPARDHLAEQPTGLYVLAFAYSVRSALAAASAPLHLVRSARNGLGRAGNFTWLAKWYSTVHFVPRPMKCTALRYPFSTSSWWVVSRSRWILVGGLFSGAADLKDREAPHLSGSQHRNTTLNSVAMSDQKERLSLSGNPEPEVVDILWMDDRHVHVLCSDGDEVTWPIGVMVEHLQGVQRLQIRVIDGDLDLVPLYTEVVCA